MNTYDIFYVLKVIKFLTKIWQISLPKGGILLWEL